LDTDRFGADQRFFDVGGDSAALLRVAANLRRDLPDRRHDPDLYACQTIAALAGRLSTGGGHERAGPADAPRPSGRATTSGSSAPPPPTAYVPVRARRADGP
jgi:hypothetical protein